MKPQRWGAVGLLIGLGLLGGCTTPPPQLYGWEHYPDQIYTYLKNPDDDPQGRAAALEADLQRFQGQSQHAPPGFHAHLGLLYSQLGRGNDAVVQWQTEKRLFPESAAFIDFLMKPPSQKGSR